MKLQTTYFKTYAEAKAIADNLPPFTPSTFLKKFDLEVGRGLPRVVEFDRGFAVQLGCCGNYYPNKTADCEE